MPQGFDARQCTPTPLPQTLLLAPSIRKTLTLRAHSLVHEIIMNLCESGQMLQGKQWLKTTQRILSAFFFLSLFFFFFFFFFTLGQHITMGESEATFWERTNRSMHPKTVVVSTHNYSHRWHIQLLFCPQLMTTQASPIQGWAIVQVGCVNWSCAQVRWLTHLLYRDKTKGNFSN